MDEIRLDAQGKNVRARGPSAADITVRQSRILLHPRVTAVIACIDAQVGSRVDGGSQRRQAQDADPRVRGGDPALPVIIASENAVGIGTGIKGGSCPNDRAETLRVKSWRRPAHTFIR